MLIYKKFIDDVFHVIISAAPLVDQGCCVQQCPTALAGVDAETDFWDSRIIFQIYCSLAIMETADFVYELFHKCY